MFVVNEWSYLNELNDIISYNGLNWINYELNGLNEEDACFNGMEHEQWAFKWITLIVDLPKEWSRDHEIWTECVQ